MSEQAGTIRVPEPEALAEHVRPLVESVKKSRGMLGPYDVADHLEAVETYGVFGTPTFVFPNGASAFVKMIKPPTGKAARTLELLSEMMSEQIDIGEIKRPQPPWPKGASTAGQ